MLPLIPLFGFLVASFITIVIFLFWSPTPKIEKILAWIFLVFNVVMLCESIHVCIVLHKTVVLWFFIVIGIITNIFSIIISSIFIREEEVVTMEGCMLVVGFFIDIILYILLLVLMIVMIVS